MLNHLHHITSTIAPCAFSFCPTVRCSILLRSLYTEFRWGRCCSRVAGSWDDEAPVVVFIKSPCDGRLVENFGLCSRLESSFATCIDRLDGQSMARQIERERKRERELTIETVPFGRRTNDRQSLCLPTGAPFSRRLLLRYCSSSLIAPWSFVDYSILIAFRLHMNMLIVQLSHKWMNKLPEWIPVRT